ncbi:MAG: hypothetical protein WA857_01640 [Candidatus Acidiferrum sp.]
MTVADKTHVDGSEPGDSFEQRKAERLLISSLARTLGTRLLKKKVDLPGGDWLEIDGYCESPLILCEAWAHIGPPKAAQKKKVMADALKMLYAERMASKHARKILLFADRKAARGFQGKNWMANALRAFEIEIHVAELPDDNRAAVENAQKRQYR